MVLLLHGETGGWDELIILVAGVVLAVVVVKMTRRAPATDIDDDEVGSGVEPSAGSDDPR